MRTLTLLLTLAVAACGSASPVGRVRFVNAPPVTRVNDRVDTPKQPKENPFYRPYYHFTSYLLLARRALNLTRDRRALGVNSLDEVPDSTFFTNRIGVRPMSIDEFAQGAPGETPQLHMPWKIKSAKVGGSVPGFICEDADGRKFLLKFSLKTLPELDSAADVITARLLYAGGWNVPSDHIVYFKRVDLVLGDKATRKVNGEKIPLDNAFIDAEMTKVNASADGTYRATASLYIGGHPLGGQPRLGTREDDPNDLVPHQWRRDARGIAAFTAWLAHTDQKEDNTLDSWEPDPANPQVHYVKHYQIDFGNSLGAFPVTNSRPQPDFVHEVDPYEWTLTFLTLGLRRQPWEGRVFTHIPGVGLYSDLDYNPAGWKPNPMGQFPVLFADRYDQFWGAKILIKITRPQLEAAVKAGHLSDSRAAPYLVDTLEKRQRRTALHWFLRVNPVDNFVTDGGTLCFDDLAIQYHLDLRPTVFTLDAYDYQGRALAVPPERVAPSERGHACSAHLPRGGTDADGHYTIVRVQTSRGIPATLVHIADDPVTRAPRVIGLHRL